VALILLLLTEIQPQLHPTHKFMWLLCCYYWLKLKCIYVAQCSYTFHEHMTMGSKFLTLW